MWKWVRRIIVGTVTLIVLVAIAGVVVFQSDWLRDRLRRLAMSQADNYLTGQLMIGKVSGSLLHGVVLDDVHLTQPDGSVFDAQRVAVTYDAVTLMHRHLVFGDIDVEHPVVRIAQGKTGWNVGHLMRPRPTTGPPLEFHLQRLRVRDGDVMILPVGSASRHLENVNVDTTIQRVGGVLSMTVGSATLHDDTSGYDVRQLAGDLVDGVRSVDVTFSANRDRAALAGRVRVSTAADGAHLDTAVDLTQVNLRAFFADPRWQSDINAHAAVQGLVTGRLDDMRLTFQVTAPRASAFGYEGRAINAKGAWAKSQLSFDASATGYGAEATIAATWQFARDSARPLAFDGEGTFRDVALPALPVQLKMPPLDSHLAGRYHAHAGRHEWHADVALEASTVEGGSIAKGTLGFITQRAGITTYTAAGAVAGMDLRRLAEPLDVPSLASDRYRSQLTGDFAITGQELCRECAVPRVIVAAAQLPSASLADAQLTDVVGAMTLIGSRLSVTGNGQAAHLTPEAMGLPASVALDLNGLVDGSLVLPDVHADLTVSNVEAAGSANLTASTVAGVAVDKASAAVSLTDGTLVVRQLQTDGVGLRVDARGTLAMGDTGVSALDVNVDADDFSPLGKRLNQPFSGAGHIEAHVTGPHNAPAATGKAALRSLAYGQDATALTLNGDLSATMPGWDPAKLTVSATSQGTFVTVKSVSITTLGGQVTYHDKRLDLDADLADKGRELKVAGQLAFEPADRSLLVHTLALSTNGQTWALPAGADATVRLNDARVAVQGLVLAKGASSVAADGDFPLKAASDSMPQGLRVKIDGVQLADLNQLLLGDRQLTGVLNGLVTITGTTDNPAIQGHVDVTGGRVDATPFASFTADGKLAAHDLVLNASLVQSGTNEFKASGHLPVGAGALSSVRPMEITLTSTPIDLGLAQLLTENATRIGGTGEVNLKVTGSPQSPIVDGTIKVDGGKFTVQGTGVGYQNVTAALTFKANHLAIDALQLSDDDGHLLQAVGGVDVLGDPGKRAFDVTITSHGVHVLNNSMGTLQVNADVEVSGDFAAPKIAGRIGLDSGRLQVDQILQQTTKSPYSENAQAGLTVEPEPGAVGGTAVSASGSTAENASTDKGSAAAPPPAPKGLLDRVIVDLNIALPDNLVMRGRGLRVGSSSIGLGDMNVIAGGQLRVLKPAGEPLNVVGDVQIVRGTYSFQGRSFDVERGSSVGFHGGDVSNPSLNVSANRDVNGVDATVKVSGTAKRPQVNLSSQPPLDEAEILSMIIFGQSLGDLGQSQRTSLASSAGAMAAGTITNPLADSVASALDLDTFEILAPTDTESMPVVSLGSTIGSRIYVGVKREIGGDSSAVSFEYRFTRFLRLVTSFAQGALQAHTLERTEAGGIDLLFVFRY